MHRVPTRVTPESDRVQPSFAGREPERRPSGPATPGAVHWPPVITCRLPGECPGRSSVHDARPGPTSAVGPAGVSADPWHGGARADHFAIHGPTFPAMQDPCRNSCESQPLQSCTVLRLPRWGSTTCDEKLTCSRLTTRIYGYVHPARSLQYPGTDPRIPGRLRIATGPGPGIRRPTMATLPGCV